MPGPYSSGRRIEKSIPALSYNDACFLEYTLKVLFPCGSRSTNYEILHVYHFMNGFQDLCLFGYTSTDRLEDNLRGVSGFWRNVLSI
jgi:hypothetical protein